MHLDLSTSHARHFRAPLALTVTDRLNHINSVTSLSMEFNAVILPIPNPWKAVLKLTTLHSAEKRAMPKEEIKSPVRQSWLPRKTFLMKAKCFESLTTLLTISYASAKAKQSHSGITVVWSNVVLWDACPQTTTINITDNASVNARCNSKPSKHVSVEALIPASDSGDN